MQTTGNFANETMKVLEIVLLSFFYVFAAFILNIPDNIAIIAVVGSLSGAVVLNYFQREHWSEMLFKTVCAALSGLFVGGGVFAYTKTENLFYIGLVFFLTSLLSLIILKAVLSFTEKNSLDFVRQIAQRIFNFQPKDKKEK